MILKWSKRTDPRYLRYIYICIFLKKASKTLDAKRRCTFSTRLPSSPPPNIQPHAFLLNAIDRHGPLSPATCKTLRRHVVTTCSTVSPFFLSRPPNPQTLRSRHSVSRRVKALFLGADSKTRALFLVFEKSFFD